jgi:hypothetical protein
VDMSSEYTYRTTETTTAPSPPDVPPEPRLLLAPSRGVQLTGILGWLARLYKLDVYSTSLLTRRAATEMGYVALMLTVITLFDLAAWGLLWNMIFNAGQLQLSGWTPAALVCASFFSAMVFIYERQFMTADTYGRWTSVIKSMAIRVVVLVIAAIITTQPIEVLVFKGPIQRRIHEESVRLEAINRKRDFEEAQRKAAGTDGNPVIGRHGQAQDALEKAQEAAARAAAAISVQETVVADREADVSRIANALRGARTERRRRYLRSALERARETVNTENATLTTLKTELGTQQELVTQATTRERETFEGVVGSANLGDAEKKRLGDWITQLRNSPPGEHQTERNPPSKPEEKPYEFDDQQYDFFQRLAVINDLYAGRPARWPSASEADIEMLGRDFALKNEASADAGERMRADRASFIFWYWAVVSIAAVIPLLVLALKGLLPHDLTIYYSRAEQIAAGNYETLRFEYDQLSEQWLADDDDNAPRT